MTWPTILIRCDLCRRPLSEYGDWGGVEYHWVSGSTRADPDPREPRERQWRAQTEYQGRGALIDDGRRVTLICGGRNCRFRKTITQPWLQRAWRLAVQAERRTVFCWEVDRAA